jgi:mannitol/fructose-specific phosphotransferase system IIA component (Ntr-type)
MRLVNFIVRDAIVADMKAANRDEAILEAVNSLVTAGQIAAADVDDIVKAIMKREKLGTTGIGHGIAIPHSRNPVVGQLTGTLCVSRGGIPFQAVDDQPVHIVILMVSPPDRPSDLLRALDNVVKTMQDEGFVSKLKAAENADEIWALLQNGGAA